jgi:hypothetical protein
VGCGESGGDWVNKTFGGKAECGARQNFLPPRISNVHTKRKNHFMSLLQVTSLTQAENTEQHREADSGSNVGKSGKKGESKEERVYRQNRPRL